jgi:hypothetical protein
MITYSQRVKDVIIIVFFSFMLSMWSILHYFLIKEVLGYGVIFTGLIQIILVPIIYGKLYYNFFNKDLSFWKSIVHFILIFSVDSSVLTYTMSITEGRGVDFVNILYRTITLILFSSLLLMAYNKLLKSRKKG